MSEADVDRREAPETLSAPHPHPLVYGAIPKIVVLFLTVVGVAYTSVANQPLIGYWEMLAVITGIVCLLSGWPHAHTKEARIHLVWTQGLHWLAFLVAMNLLLVSDVQKMLNVDATGLAILLILALGTFVAGVHILSWEICVLGLVMALGVPAIAWIEQSALLLVLAAVVLVLIAAAFLWFGRRRSGSVDRAD